MNFFTLFADSVRVLARMRWFLWALLIALPLANLPLEIGIRHTQRKIEQRTGQKIDRGRTFQAKGDANLYVQSGLSSAGNVYRKMGFGNAAWLAAIFVLARPRWVRRWLAGKAKLQQSLSAIFWLIIIGAAANVLLPLAMFVDFGREPQEIFIYFAMACGLFSGWFSACLAAFLQTTLYPLLLRAWAGQSPRWRDVGEIEPFGWLPLCGFNLVVEILVGYVLLAAPTWLFSAGWFSQAVGGTYYALRIGFGYLRSALWVMLMLVPFAVAVKKLRFWRGFSAGISEFFRNFFKLAVLILPLGAVFASIWLGLYWMWAQSPDWLVDVVARMAAQMIVAVVTAVGLVAGARIMGQLERGKSGAAEAPRQNR
jgi:hypothetical protein